MEIEKPPLYQGGGERRYCLEEWRDVVGYEGLYEVSNLGNIRSLPKYNFSTTRIIKQTLNKKRGRLSVMLCHDPQSRKRCSVHRLVAEAFVKNNDPQKYTEVNHKDENPLNNRADNLEWCDRWYNMHYKDLQSRVARPQRKAIVGKATDGSEIRFTSLTEANKHGFCSRIISSIVNGHRKSGKYYKGYCWEVEYANK